MTTRAQLRTQINNNGVNTTNYSGWDSTLLNQLINEAILDYQLHFPRGIRTTTQALTTGTQAYDLPSDFESLYRVECPTGEDPPTYLEFLDETEADFEDGGDYYFIRDKLVLAPEVTTGQTAKLWYYATHTQPATDGEALTPPDKDLDILIAHVLWRAYVFRLTVETGNPSNDNLWLDTMRVNADRHKQWYDDLVKKRKRRHARARFPVWATAED